MHSTSERCKYKRVCNLMEQVHLKFALKAAQHFEFKQWKLFTKPTLYRSTLDSSTFAYVSQHYRWHNLLILVH